jgi:NAD(P)-dependent dehydrogenase (short-subunit alcohol dehydrogenase family)
MEIQGSVVVVTGASSGIKLATARRFARAGAKVVLAARSSETINELAEEPISREAMRDNTVAGYCNKLFKNASRRSSLTVQSSVQSGLPRTIRRLSIDEVPSRSCRT